MRPVRQPRAVETRERIAGEAARSFALKGYHDTKLTGRDSADDSLPRAAHGGCVIGNLSTSLSDTHDAFRRRLAEWFDEMELEFRPHLAAAAAILTRSGPLTPVRWRAISSPSSRARSCSPAPRKIGP